MRVVNCQKVEECIEREKREYGSLHRSIHSSSCLVYIAGLMEDGSESDMKDGLRWASDTHTLTSSPSIPLSSTIYMPSARTMSAGPFAVTVRMKRELLGEVSLH